MIRTIADDGINWNWYLCADFDDLKKTAHVYYYDRWHKYESGSKHPKSEYPKTGRLNLIESDNRILLNIVIDNNNYIVTNPQYVFDYRDFTHYEAE